MIILTGPLLRVVRQGRRLKLSDIAAHTQYSRAYLSMLERGVAPVTEAAYQRIQAAFKAIGVTDTELHLAAMLMQVGRHGA